jgi:copper oxidase (laccase) domain-containing protein
MILPFPQTVKNLVALLSTKEEEFSSQLAKLKLPQNQIVGMRQKHTDHVRWVGKKDLGARLIDTDALIAGEKGIFLTVRVADCIPVLYLT